MECDLLDRNKEVLIPDCKTIAWVVGKHPCGHFERSV